MHSTPTWRQRTTLSLFRFKNSKNSGGNGQALPEEMRSTFEDFTRARELTHLVLKYLHPGLLFGRDADFHAIVDVGLAHPSSHRFAAKAELIGGQPQHSLPRVECHVTGIHTIRAAAAFSLPAYWRPLLKCRVMRPVSFQSQEPPTGPGRLRRP